MTVLAGEDQVVVRAAITQAWEQLDHGGDQIDVSSLAVLRRSERAARVARADAYYCLLEIDITPAEGE